MIKDKLRKAKYFFQDVGTKGYVLMLHRVSEIDNNGIFMNENMKVSPKFLEDFILNYKNVYDFIPSTKITDRLKSRRYNKKFIVFTMDDGYLDNYTTAFPVFSKYNIPFTIFIATDFPNRNCFLWWYILGDMILKNDCIKTSDGTVFECSDLDSKNQTFEKLRLRVLCLNQNDLVAEFKKLFNAAVPDLRILNEKYCMSWENVEAVYKNPLVTIGTHTAHHCNLRALATESDVIREIHSGVYELQNHLAGYVPSVFAYPFGSPLEIGRREIGAVEKMGFQNAFLGYGRGVKSSSDMFAIPRIAFTENFDLSILK